MLMQRIGNLTAFNRSSLKVGVFLDAPGILNVRDLLSRDKQAVALTACRNP